MKRGRPKHPLSQTQMDTVFPGRGVWEGAERRSTVTEKGPQTVPVRVCVTDESSARRDKRGCKNMETGARCDDLEGRRGSAEPAGGGHVQGSF